jgi:heme-degrading monooxygenase HmoA
MNCYKAIVQYHFKKGEEEKGYKLLEQGLNKLSSEKGCQSIELLRNEKHPSRVIGIAVWDSIEDARDFQTKWQSKEDEISQHCETRPHHEFLKCCTVFGEKKRKAA